MKRSHLISLVLIACATAQTAIPQGHAVDDVLEVFRRATPEEQEKMVEWAFSREGREIWLRREDTAEYIELLCALRPGPERDSEFATAGSGYRLFDVKAVADPVKRELMGDALIDCDSPMRVVSGGLDTRPIKALRLAEESHTRIKIQQSPIEIEEPSISEERSASPDCKPLTDTESGLCDDAHAHLSVSGCERKRRTTCDPTTEGLDNRTLENLTRSMGMSRGGMGTNR